jgi:peptide/nickel transport system permease protein
VADVSTRTATPAAARARPAAYEERFAVLRVLARDRAGLIGFVILLLVVLAAVFGPLITPHDPTAFSARRLASPGGPNLLGTDEFGRDLLTRALYGARVSLEVAAVAVALASGVGILIGVLSGFYGRWVDGISMRFMDILFAFPTILLALAVVAMLGPDIRNLELAIAIVYVPVFARLARAATLVVAAQPYVEAARSIGAADGRIMRQHIAPNILAPLVVQFTINIAYAILVESSLSYLGLGIQPPTPSWGSMLSTGKQFVETSLWPTLVPGGAIMLTVLGCNLLGDALRDAADPRLRMRRSD